MGANRSIFPGQNRCPAQASSIVPLSLASIGTAGEEKHQPVVWSMSAEKNFSSPLAFPVESGFLNQCSQD
jgi:hypothetical protein